MIEKVLVIPDIHLKPNMIILAESIMQDKNEQIDAAVFLGDIPDDWDQQGNLTLYNETFYALQRRLIEKYPCYYCLGNHEASYIWNKQESGKSSVAGLCVWSWISDLRRKLGDSMGFAFKINNVIFSHAGITSAFADRLFLGGNRTDDELINRINESGADILWRDDGPLWVRPDSALFEPYSLKYLQVVGHTPIAQPLLVKDRFLLCDTFSTYCDGRNIGSCEFIIVNTFDQTWSTIRAEDIKI